MLTTGLLTAFDSMFKRLHDLESTQKELLEKVSDLSTKPQRPRSTISYMDSPFSEEDELVRGHARRAYGKLSSHLSPEVSTSNDSFAVSPHSTSKLEFAQSTATLSSPVNGAPKLFAKLPADVLNAGLTKQELMRLSVVYELIETEADYVKDLGIMINVNGLLFYQIEKHIGLPICKIPSITKQI